MKILVFADYPRSSHRFSGIFNQRCVKVLQELCDTIQVISHRPYVPSFVSWVPLLPQWKTWAATTAAHEIIEAVSIHRPGYIQIPRIGSAFWADKGAFLACRRKARVLHAQFGFDAILSFNLFGAGGPAWRVGEDLGIPASGWATGSDVRQPAGTALERIVVRTIERLDLVFYQSRELFEIAARLMKTTPAMMRKEKHVVLPRGIPEPPSMCKTEIASNVRMSLGIKEKEVLVVNVGRILRSKGIFELLESLCLAVGKNPRIRCVIVGSRPGFDETVGVQKVLDQTPILKERVRLLPACIPDKVWEYLCAADIFAFPSHNEGMPNTLLEAMAIGLPSVAFGIPPVLEIAAETGAVVLVPPLDAALFADALLHLASSADERVRIGERGAIQVRERYMVRNNMGEALKRITQIVNERKSKIRKHSSLADEMW